MRRSLVPVLRFALPFGVRFAFAFSVLAFLASASSAQTGGLDPSFGTGGTVTTDFGARDDVGRALALLPDGRLVVAGYAEGEDGAAFALARYTPGGALDPSFGTGGTLTLAPDSGTHRAHALALLPDGRMVVAGLVGGGDFGVARLLPDGTPDSTFGEDGWVTTDFGGGEDEAHAIVLQPDGRIVVGGSSRFGAADGFALARYDADGSPDSTFGTDGRVTTGAASGVDRLAALLLQPDGHLVAVGTGGTEGSLSFALVRYLPSGSLDPAFGAGGLVTTSLGPLDDAATTAVLQPDGRLVVGGYTRNREGSFFAFALARYLPDGTPDAGFGTAGVTFTPFPSGFASIYRLALQPDGRLVAVGPARANAPEVVALARYDTTGALDPSFGMGGTATVQFGRFVDTPYDLALQPDGRIVVAGSTYVGFNLGFALLRYDPDLVVAPEPAGSAQTAAALAVHPNPVRHGATIHYVAPEAGAVRIALHDVLGREVAVIHQGALTVGTHTLALDVTALPSGHYVLRAVGAGGNTAHPVTVVR